jgi:cytochrome c oxidase assembly protein subunit 15
MKIFKPRHYIPLAGYISRRYIHSGPVETIPRDKAMSRWLFACAGIVAGIVVVGGMTRLTESGLSMVDWSLLHYKPPRTNTEWLEYFEKYKASPEWQILNRDMTVEEFKRIYYMEYGHRMLGRFLGVFYTVPMCYFLWTRKSMSMRDRGILVGVAGMIFCQGLLGWYMVKSGLDPIIIENREHPRVSPYRLTAHLGLAFIIYLTLWRQGLKYSNLFTSGFTAFNLAPVKRNMILTSKLVFLTALSGAFVAGLDAGVIYNTFPKMGGLWVPSDAYTIYPVWRDIFENPTTAQFHHRILAMSSLGAIIGTWFNGIKLFSSAQLTVGRYLLHSFAGAAMLQVSLGIGTLLYVVPIPLATAHQAGSLTLLTVAVTLLHYIKRVVR